jgi:hypothetical protein
MSARRSAFASRRTVHGLSGRPGHSCPRYRAHSALERRLGGEDAGDTATHASTSATVECWKVPAVELVPY